MILTPHTGAECVPYLLPPDPAPCPECGAPGGERCPETCPIVIAVRACEYGGCPSLRSPVARLEALREEWAMRLGVASFAACDALDDALAIMTGVPRVGR